MKSVDYVRSEDEPRQAAEFQFQALKISADHFDLGQIGEAARMANAIFMLLGRGMRSHCSIFDAAGQTEKRLYRSTKPADDAKGCSLVRLELRKIAENEWDASIRHAGRLALREGRDLGIDEWWNELIIQNDASNLSRGEIIRILRDKNGGAHFGPVVSDELEAQAIRGELGLFNIRNPDGSLETVPFGLEHCVRQIAVELWYSIDSNKSFDVPYANNCSAAYGY